MSARLFAAALWGAAVVAVLFFLLPVAALFLRVPPGQLIDQLGSGVVLDALRVTVKTNLTAFVLVVVFGTPTAYLIASRRFAGRNLVVTLPLGLVYRHARTKRDQFVCSRAVLCPEVFLLRVLLGTVERRFNHSLCGRACERTRACRL